MRIVGSEADLARDVIDFVVGGAGTHTPSGSEVELVVVATTEGRIAAEVRQARAAHPDLPVLVFCERSSEVAAAIEAGADDAIKLTDTVGPELYARIAAVVERRHLARRRQVTPPGYRIQFDPDAETVAVDGKPVPELRGAPLKLLLLLIERAGNAATWQEVEAHVSRASLSPEARRGLAHRLRSALGRRPGIRLVGSHAGVRLEVDPLAASGLLKK